LLIVLQSGQGTVDKVVVVIKDKEQVALERFIFSVESMIQVEAFNKDTRFNPFPSERTQSLIVCFSQRRGCHVWWFPRAVFPFISR
jgi:hypothetical protein